MHPSRGRVGLAKTFHLLSFSLRQGVARYVFAIVGLLAIVATDPSYAAQQCMTVSDLTCASGFQGCPTGWSSRGCSYFRRTCCRDTSPPPAPPNTGGGTIGGGPGLPGP